MTTGWIKASELNLRASPNAGGTLLATMPEGAVVQVLAPAVMPDAAAPQGWVEVSYNGQSGYASAQWIETRAAAPPAVAYAADWTAAACLRLAIESKKRGIAPLDAAAVMFSESSMRANAAAHNVDGDVVAVGINQLSIPGDVFRNAVPGMTPEAYLALSAYDQIPYAFRYWDSLAHWKGAGIWKSARNLYWANFWPKNFDPNAPDDFVIVPQSPRDAWALASNPGLVSGGTIKPSDLVAALARAQHANPQRWGEIAARIRWAEVVVSSAGAIPILGLAAFTLAALGSYWYFVS